MGSLIPRVGSLPGEVEEGKRSRPVAGDGEAALGTVPCFEVILEDVVPGTAKEKLVASGAVGICRVGIDVALVEVMEAGFTRDLTGSVERLGRSRRLIL